MTIDHPDIVETRALVWSSEADCARDAAAMAAKPALRDACIELCGPLGAGKTTFARHLLRALGVEGRIKSPTYALMEPYCVEGLQIAHFDFYRFGDAREWIDAGFRDVFAGPGLKLVEWPSHAAPQLPLPDLRLHIEPDASGETRHVSLEALTARGKELLH
jgi:tRNA threonylcarbamoyladenosine biosynthesis protein TsaE